MEKLILFIVTLLFAALSGMALWHHGYWGILAPHFRTFGAAQVLADLVIALGLVLWWMVGDARRHSRNPWPWIALTLVAGSFGPLFYLLTRQQRSQPHPQGAARRA